MSLKTTHKHSSDLIIELNKIIQQGKNKVAVAVISTLTLVFWQVGKKINDFALGGERAEYGKEIVKSLSIELVEKFGRSFASRNLRRMMQFAEEFSDFGIVVPLARQLTWSHFIILIPLKDEKTRLYYANKAIEASWGKRELRKQIERKSYERAQIADTQIIKGNNNSELTVFKDRWIRVISAPYVDLFMFMRDRKSNCVTSINGSPREELFKDSIYNFPINVLAPIV